MVRFFSSISSVGKVLTLVSASLAVSVVAATQDAEKKKPADAAIQSKDTGKPPSQKELEKDKKKPAASISPGEATVELALIAYGTRKQLETTRAAIQEQGTIRLATDQGDSTGSYMLRSIRKEKSWQDLLRVDLELTPPAAMQSQVAPKPVTYVIAFNGASVWSAQNGQYVTARPEVESAFKAQLVRDYTTLLRYKEDGSKVELKGPETVVGVPTNVVELTLSDGSRTKYWLSAKTFRILHLEYEYKPVDGQPPIRFRISYYYTPLRVVQNTLVPTRRVMTQDGKFVQEITLTNFVYSAKLAPEIFQHLQDQ